METPERTDNRHLRALARIRAKLLAVNPEPTLVGSDRLDSWKAIAEYLSRDVATVRRWEKSAGLPVRRVAGNRGHSVFAYRSEIDGWLKTTPSKTTQSDSDLAHDWSRRPSQTSVPALTAASAPAKTRPIWRWWVVTTAITVVLMSVAWRVRTSWGDDAPSNVDVRPDSIVATDANGAERWRYVFPGGERNVVLVDRQGKPARIFSGDDPGVLVGIAQRVRATPESGAGGQLLWLSLAGSLKRTFAFNDRLPFGSETFSEPWMLTDVVADPISGKRRLAVTAHHFHWWPSIVTVLDSQWTRRGTFVNSGWVLRLDWLSRDRLLLSGFSNARDGGMVALVDANALDGQSPPTDDAKFTCTTCPSGRPLRYIVFPRSEVNRLTASPFNRAVVEDLPDRIFVRTVEVPAPANGSTAVDVLYEFTRGLDLIRASYSDRYWEVHRALELQGKINHTRDRCPDRDGPRFIEMWEPASGWKTINTRH
jgi:hypothetical protein